MALVYNKLKFVIKTIVRMLSRREAFLILQTTQKKKPIICIGGANVDRKFYAKEALLNETSNPITSSTTAGGVARNIAENLGRLGENVLLFSVRGKDADWLEIAQASETYVDVTHVHEIEGAATGAYTAVLNNEGDLSIAFADMEIFEALTPHLLKDKEALLTTAKCLVIDLNCPKETVVYIKQLATKHAIPLMIVPVSSPKMNRLPNDLAGVTWLIVNKEETETYFNCTIQNEKGWQRAVEKWLTLGVQQVIVTNGGNGAMAGNQSVGIKHYQSIDTPNVIDVTGAGDSFCSAVLHTWLQNASFDRVIQAGLVNSHKTILSKHTVRKELSTTQLQLEMEELTC